MWLDFLISLKIKQAEYIPKKSLNFNLNIFILFLTNIIINNHQIKMLIIFSKPVYLSLFKVTIYKFKICDILLRFRCIFSVK